jgi:quercetin dioxygenase-like cupin family protein
MAHGIAQLAPGGYLEQCVLAYEKSIYVFEGELDLMLDGRVYRLIEDDFALILVGAPHALRSSTSSGARWMEMIAPQPLPKSVGEDTFFVGAFDWPLKIERFDRGDARTRQVGHFADAQLPPPGNLQMDGYSGDGARRISQKMMVDRNFGSAHMTMFVVEFAEGGGGSHHTHPFEESYFFVAGTAECEFEGRRYVVEPGTLCWTSVGAKHAIYTKGEPPVRFIETQTPQPPARQAFRFDSEWRAMRERYPD